MTAPVARVRTPGREPAERAFALGTLVRVAPRRELERLHREGALDPPLEPRQFLSGGRAARVVGAHLVEGTGGLRVPRYALAGLPGLWPPQHLRAV